MVEGVVGVEGQPPLYVFTEQGYKTQEEIDRAAIEAGRRRWTPTLGSPWLCFALIGALLAWFFDTTPLFKTAERYLEQRQERAAREYYQGQMGLIQSLDQN